MPTWKIRLLFLGLGILVGVLAGGVPGAIIYRNTVKNYNERMKMFETMTAQSIKNTSDLREENKKLRTRTVERVNADGSTETITEVDKDSSVNSERQTREIAMLQHSLRALKEKKQTETTTEVKYSPKLGGGVGVDQDMNTYFLIKYGSGVYVWGTGSTNLYTKEHSFVLGVGMEF